MITVNHHRSISRKVDHVISVNPRRRLGALGYGAAGVFHLAETRSGENVREFLGQNGERPWKGKLVTDGFSGHVALEDMLS